VVATVEEGTAKAAVAARKAAISAVVNRGFTC
jgi:hypothetical protein